MREVWPIQKMRCIKYFTQLGILASIINISVPFKVLAGFIIDGNYENIYPDNYVIKIRNNQFSIFYDDSPQEPWKPIPKAFRAVKPGVFYSTGDKKYYCLSNNKLEKERRRRRGTSAAFICKSFGWQY